MRGGNIGKSRIGKDEGREEYWEEEEGKMSPEYWEDLKKKRKNGRIEDKEEESIV